MAGIFGETFLVSVSHETKHENSSKNSGKIRSKFGAKIRDENSKKIGELLFCDFSDLSKSNLWVTDPRGFWQGGEEERRAH